MVYNIFKWGKREKAEEIVSHSRLNCSCYTVAEAPTPTSPNNMNASESNYETQPQHKQSVGVAHVECTTTAHIENHFVNGNKQAHRTDACHRQQTDQHTISTVHVYLIFVTLFTCVCTIVLLLSIRINQANDGTQLGDKLHAELIGRHEIEQMVQRILNDMKISGNAFR